MVYQYVTSKSFRNTIYSPLNSFWTLINTNMFCLVLIGTTQSELYQSACYLPILKTSCKVLPVLQNQHYFIIYENTLCVYIYTHTHIYIYIYECMNLQEGTKRTHFQSTTEMKINTIPWGKVAGKLRGKISSSIFLYPSAPHLFSSLHKLLKLFPFMSLRWELSLAAIQLVTAQNSTHMNSLWLSMSALHVIHCLSHMLCSSIENNLEEGNFKQI